MSDSADRRIAELEREVRAAQELLFLTLDYVGEPVVLDIDAAREVMKEDRMIDVQLDTDKNLWTLKVVDKK